MMRTKRLEQYKERMLNYEPPEPVAKKRGNDSDEVRFALTYFYLKQHLWLTNGPFFPFCNDNTA